MIKRKQSIKRIKGLIVLEPKRFYDNRGFFSETWNQEREKLNGITQKFVQDNHSYTYEAGTIRGLHCQIYPKEQIKLVRCGRGSLFDVAVDIRVGSPTFGSWFGIELSFRNGKQLYIPEGFLHGFMTLEENTEIIYKCSQHYSLKNELSVHYSDPTINIQWPKIGPKILTSKKDNSAPHLSDINSPFMYESL